MAAKASTIRKAFEKAERIRPELLQLCDGFWVAPSATRPNKGYMLEVNGQEVSCECPGFAGILERDIPGHGYCYHAAALAKELGYTLEDVIASTGLEALPGPVRQGDTVYSPAGIPLGRKHLFD